MSNHDNIEVHGVKEDGTHVFLGHAATVPLEVKRKDIVANFFEPPSGDDNDYSDANSCLWALEEYHKWLVEQGWRGPKLNIIPAELDHRAATDVLAERRRQINSEGWTPEHDDEHDSGELAGAAACYAKHTNARGWVFEAGRHDDYRQEPAPDSWPFDPSAWKPTDPIRDLEKAGALILAEIERRHRAKRKQEQDAA